MKNAVSALKYLFKNFIYMALFMLPLSVLFALKYNSSYFFDYLLKLNVIGSSTLGNIYLHFSLLPDFKILPILLWAAIIVVSYCLVISFTERHMKFGIRSPLKAIKSVNFSVMAVLPAIFVIFVLEELFAFFIALFVNLFSLSPSPFIVYILPAIYILMMLLLFSIYSVIALWIPIKMVTGYSHTDSIRYSIRLTQGRQAGIIFGIALPLLISLPLMYLLKHFCPVEIINTIIYTLCYVLILSYYGVYTMTLYFSLSNTQRKDKKKNILKGKF